MAKITIKTLSGFPVYNFEDGADFPELIKVGFESSVSVTGKESHVYDTDKKNRVIQSINYDLFEIKSILALNIDISKLIGANFVYIESENYGNFYANDIEIEQEYGKGGDVIYTIKLKKQISINYELSSDFAQSLHSDLPVNVLNFKIANPPYSFNNITISNSASAKALFQLPLTDLTDTIAVSDYFYLHTNNTIYNNLIDDSGDYLNFAKCINKDSDFVYFESSNDILTLANSNVIINLTINNIESYPNVPAGITINDKTIELNIYSFLNYKIKPFNEVKENVSRYDYIDLTGKSVNSKILHFPIWLTDNELYKATYLRYANEIKLITAKGEEIIPISKTKVIEYKEKETLLNLHEFMINLEIEHTVFCNLNGNIY